jgi:plasmid stabilization system protein ParE
MAEHVVSVTDGDVDAARRRLDEADALFADIASNPGSGTRLAGALAGWLVRHGGRGRRLTVVFRHDAETDTLLIALVAFGGQNWQATGEGRTGALE